MTTVILKAQSISIYAYIDEAIFQKCLYMNTYTKDPNYYWSYIENYYNNCNEEKQLLTTLEDCRTDIISKFSNDNINFPDFDSHYNNIITCFNNSFTGEKYNSINRVLKNDELSYKYKYVYLIPSVYINSELLKENYKAGVIMSEICDSFVSENDYCVEYFAPKFNLTVNSTDTQIYPTDSSSLIILLVIILLSFIILILLLKIIVAKRVKKNINDEVNEYVINYFRVPDK